MQIGAIPEKIIVGTFRILKTLVVEIIHKIRMKRYYDKSRLG